MYGSRVCFSVLYHVDACSFEGTANDETASVLYMDQASSPEKPESPEKPSGFRV